MALRQSLRQSGRLPLYLTLPCANIYFEINAVTTLLEWKI